MTSADERQLLLERRSFLRLCALTLGGPLIGAGCGDPAARRDEGPERSGVFREWMSRGPAGSDGDPLADAQALGELYLVSYRGDTDALERALAATDGIVAKSRSVQSAVDALDAALLADLAADRLESLLGWQLGRTELHICALARRLAP